MAQETITMAQKELSKYEIIKNLIDKKINGTQMIGFNWLRSNLL